MIEIIQTGRSKRLLKKLQNETELIDSFESGIREAFYFLGQDLKKLTQAAIKNPPKTGRLYRLYKSQARLSGKLFHRASAPGEAPADLTGRLRKRTHYVNSETQLEFGYDSSTPYGAYLEHGTRRMGARPNIINRAKEDAPGLGQTHAEEQINKSLKNWLR